MALTVFEHDDYKRILRERTKELARIRPGFTLKRLAERIRIQYTYLSKVLNRAEAHLGEDHLFQACRFLELYPEETDYVLLLRARDASQDDSRRAHLARRLERMRRARRVRADVRGGGDVLVEREMEYLFDPLGVLIHVSLHIDRYREKPSLLASALGISDARLRGILVNLEKLGFIELGDGPLKVRKVLQGRIHYSTEHPLMRVHQNLLRQYGATQLQRTPEADKHSFMATFTADAASAREIREAFQDFVSRVQAVAVKAPATRTFQMNFDLFPWV